MIDILVTDWVNVTTAALHKKRNRILAQVVLNGLGGEAGDVRGVASTGHSLDWVAGKIVNHRQRPAIHPVQAQHANLRVHRADRSNVFIRRQRISTADINLLAAF